MSGFFVALLLAVVFIFLLRSLSHKIGLIDLPGGRKQHAAPTPTIGGLAMFIAVILTLYWNDSYSQNLILLIACAAMLVVLGVLDDKHGLPVRARMLIQILLALVVILNAGGTMSHLGPLLGGADVVLGMFAVPFSLIAFVGGINAMNMIDGADGMAGKMAIVSTLGVAVLFYLAGAHTVLPLVWAMLGALMGFLFFNARWFVRRAWVFMGDAGSMWLGLVLVWFMIQIPQAPVSGQPALGLWLFGIPLLDTLAVMLRRKKRARSVFAADRTHIHHVLQDMGSSVKRTVFVLTLVQVMMVSIGVCFYLIHAPSWIVFWSFILTLAGYYYRFRNC